MNSNIPAQKNQPETTPISESDWMPRHFDFNGTEKPVRFDEIIVDPAYQMRTEGTNPEIVKRYAEIMKQNDPDGWLAFPLIKLLRRKDADSKLFLISGFHRLEAMKLNGYDKIEAVVSRGTHLNGLILAAGENADRSQPRTNADIQNIVEMFLTDPELCQWNNAQIARWAQVDAQTVANHERRLLSTPNFGIDNRPETRKFIDKHGNVSERKAPSPPPDLGTDDAKQRKTEFQAYIKHRNAAFHAWEAYCEQWEIPFDWESFCLDAEKHLNGRGCVSAINPEEATLDQIREKSLTWQKMKSAISHGANWVVSHRAGLDFTQKQKAKESRPDREGLRKNLEAMVGSDTAPNPSILTKLYNVPETEIHAEIEAVFGVEEEKPQKPTAKEVLLKEIEELHDAPNGIYGLLPSVDPDTHIARSQFMKVNYHAFPTYSWRDHLKDDALEKLRNTLLQIKVHILERGVDWFRTDTEAEPEKPTELQSQPLSDPEPKEEKSKEPAWIQIIFHGECHTGEIDRHVFRVDTPMADEYVVPIAKAAVKAAEDAYTRISAERNEERA